MRRLFSLVCVMTWIVTVSQAQAQNAGNNDVLLQKQLEALQQELQQLKQTVATQQKTIDQLKQGKAEPLTAAMPSAPGESSIAQQFPKSSIANKGALPAIPDIGVVGDIVGTKSDTLDKNEGNNRISVREVELVLGSDIDPYARWDSVFTFSDYEDPDIEEAYVSYWGLPGETKARIGRFHQAIGKAASTHRDSLDTVDEPLVVQRYIGPEGLFRTGADITGFLPSSTDRWTQQLTFGVLEGGVGKDGELLADTPSKPTFYAHLGNFLELADETTLDLGGNYMLGSASETSYSAVNLLGVDATLVHHFSPMNKFKLQSEFYFVQQGKGTACDGNDPVIRDTNPIGWYVLADYRLGQRWAMGGRLDWVQPIILDEEQTREEERAVSTYLSFFQSEFARWRLEYQYALLLNGDNDNRIFLQGTFAIGTHKHQIQ